MHFFSRSTRGFYHRDLHGDAIPEDAVELSTEQYDAVMQGCSLEACIAVGSDGYPVIQPRPAPAAEPAERHWRDQQINQVQWLRDRHHDELELGRTTTLTAERYEGLLHYLQALREWPQAKDFPSPAHRPAPQPWLLALTTRNQPL
jgi:hypothetical protein